MNEILSKTYFYNTVQDYLIVFGSILLGMAMLRLFRKTLLKRLVKWSESTDTPVDDYIVDGIKRFGLPILNFTLLYFGVNYLTLSETSAKYVHSIVSVIITFFALRLISSTVLLILQANIRKQDQGEVKVKQIGGIMLLLNIMIWSIGLLFLFDNLGYNVTTIVAGLGIGGIAIALAAQNILGDLFNYFVIFFDRPFEIGDFIVVDDKRGHVEHIGIKTTRVKSLTGEQLVFSNSDLTKSRIHNFKHMERRRIAFNLGVVFDTPLEQLRKIPAMISQIITEQEGATLDHVHFLAYGEYNLKFEVIYFVESAEYNQYVEIQQAINLRIFEVFKQNNIRFAYPTQTIISTKSNSPQ